jgi:hypothetical protein
MVRGHGGADVNQPEAVFTFRREAHHEAALINPAMHDNLRNIAVVRDVLQRKEMIVIGHGRILAARM